MKNDWKNRLSRVVSSPYSQKLSPRFVHVRSDQLPGPVIVKTPHVFPSLFGPVILEGKIGTFDPVRQRYLPLKVISAPKELDIVTDWVDGDPIPGYKCVLENEQYKLEGCYVNAGMLHVNHVTIK